MGYVNDAIELLMEYAASAMVLVQDNDMQWWYALPVILVLFTLRGHAVRKVFKLPVTCLFMGSDMGGNKNPYFVSGDGVHGAPDAVFFDWLRLTFVVGEYKSINHNGQVKWRENFQVILYMGILPPWYWPRCRGYIAYGCGNVVKIAYSRKYFNGLLKLKKELEQAKKSWVPTNTIPLQRR
jgi:hypothetical protein